MRADLPEGLLIENGFVDRKASLFYHLTTFEGTVLNQVVYPVVVEMYNHKWFRMNLAMVEVVHDLEVLRHTQYCGLA